MSTSGQVSPSKIAVTTVHSNTELTLIQVTEDKLRLVLVQHLKASENSRRWHVPPGVLLAVIPMFLTSDFKDFLGIERATWRAFFMLSGVATFGWLLLTIRSAFDAPSEEQLVERIKNKSKSDA